MKQTLVIVALMISAIGFSQKEETINSGNSKLHFKTFGKGEPILIINGGPGMNCEGFAYLAEEVSKFGYETIIYDQRGTGRSIMANPNTKTINLDLMVADIENLRKHLKVEKWTVLGHSFGGMLAAYYTTKHPNRIEKLVLSSSGGVNMNFIKYAQSRITANLTKNQRDSVDFFHHKIDNGDNSFKTRKLRAKYLANAYVYDKSKAPLIAERLIQVNFDINSIVFQNLRSHFDCTNKFKSFTKPVLVLQGENDIISVETALETAAAFPKSKLVLMKNCGHYGWLDSKELYFNSIQHFLKS